LFVGWGCYSRILKTHSFVVATLCLSLLGSAHLASLEAGVGGGLDVLLGGHSHHVGGNGNDLLSNGDVFLSDEDSGLVDGVSEGLLLGADSLESSLQKLRDVQGQDVIELSLVFSEESESDHSSDEGLTCMTE
jgi:hypothetical protein